MATTTATTTTPNELLHDLYCERDQLQDEAAIWMSDYNIACRYADKPDMHSAQDMHATATLRIEQITREIHRILQKDAW